MYDVAGHPLLGLADEGKETPRDGVPLENKGSHEKVEANAAKSVPLKERHQKSKTDENHDMNVLEHCTKEEGEEEEEGSPPNHATIETTEICR